MAAEPGSRERDFCSGKGRVLEKVKGTGVITALSGGGSGCGLRECWQGEWEGWEVIAWCRGAAAPHFPLTLVLMGWIPSEISPSVM